MPPMQTDGKSIGNMHTRKLSMHSCTLHLNPHITFKK